MDLLGRGTRIYFTGELWIGGNGSRKIKWTGVVYWKRLGERWEFPSEIKKKQLCAMKTSRNLQG